MRKSLFILFLEIIAKMAEDDFKSSFRKLFYRFLKEHGLFFFITNEIKKEYKGGIDEFISFVVNKGIILGMFVKRSILSFDWRITGGSLEDGLNFWRQVDSDWRRFCRINDFFNII